MKKKLFTLFTLLLCVCSGAWADEVTIGRTLEFSSTPTAYTMVSDDNATVTQSDGSGIKTGTGKGLFYKTTSSTKIYATCYKSQYGTGNLSEYKDDVYAGFKVVLADGKKMTISQMNASVAVFQNFTYKVVLLDAGGTAIYTSADKVITNYSSTSATNLDATIAPDGGVGEVTGTFYVRLYYYYAGSTSKYLAPLNLTITGEITDYAQTNYSQPLISEGDYDQATGTYPVTLSVQNDEDGTINYTVGDNDEVTGAASGTVINVAPGTTVSAYVTGATYSNSEANEITTSAMPTLATPTYVVSNYDLFKNVYTVTLSASAGDIYYSIGGDATAYTSALSLAPGTSVTAYATQTNMTQSAELVFSVPAAPIGGSASSPTTSGTYSSNVSYDLGPITIPGACIAGQISSGTTPINNSIKTRCNQSLTSGTGFYVTVNSSYKVTGISIEGCSNQTGANTCTAVYVDGEAVDGFESVALPLAEEKGSTGSISVADISATSKIEFVFENTYQGQMKITVTYDVSDTSTLSALEGYSKGFVTFCAPNNFTITGASAYKAQVIDDAIVLTEIEGVIPASTGVIIAGNDEAEYTIALVSDKATTVTDNDLLGVTERTLTTTLAGSQSLLALNSDNATFNEYNGTYFPANKAYLLVDGASSRSLSIEFDDNTTTAIVNVNSNENEGVVKKYLKDGNLIIKTDKGNFNVAGTRVSE